MSSEESDAVEGAREGRAVIGVDVLEIASASNRCTACGACDRVYTGYERANRAIFRGPSQLPLAILREPLGVARAYAWLVELDKVEVAALERHCPGKVPLARLRDVLAAHAPRPPVTVEERPKKHDPG